MFSSITFSRAIWEQGMRWMNCSHSSLLWSLVFLGTPSLGTIPVSQDWECPEKGTADGWTIHPSCFQRGKKAAQGRLHRLADVSQQFPSSSTFLYVLPTYISCRSTPWINLSLPRTSLGYAPRLVVPDVCSFVVTWPVCALCVHVPSIG